jgi:hypothetical protein
LIGKLLLFPSPNLSLVVPPSQSTEVQSQELTELAAEFLGEPEPIDIDLGGGEVVNLRVDLSDMSEDLLLAVRVKRLEESVDNFTALLELKPLLEDQVGPARVARPPEPTLKTVRGYSFEELCFEITSSSEAKWRRYPMFYLAVLNELCART